MDQRYGKFAQSVKKIKAYHCIFKEGILFLFTSNNEPVADSLSHIDFRHRVINARLIGIKNGDERFLKELAQNEVYHAILHWASHNDIQWINFQGCEPLLTKGTFQYKKRLGSIATLPYNSFYNKRLLVKLNSNHPHS